MIPDDDVQQSKGVSGASKQLVVPDQVASSIPVNFSPSKGPSDPGQTPISPSGGAGEGSYGPSLFVPTWSLHNESHLSVRANAMEFAQHAFPLVTIADMEAMGSASLSHNMSYATM